MQAAASAHETSDISTGLAGLGLGSGLESGSVLGLGFQPHLHRSCQVGRHRANPNPNPDPNCDPNPNLARWGAAESG